MYIDKKQLDWLRSEVAATMSEYKLNTLDAVYEVSMAFPLTHAEIYDLMTSYSLCKNEDEYCDYTNRWAANDNDFAEYDHMIGRYANDNEY